MEEEQEDEEVEEDDMLGSSKDDSEDAELESYTPRVIRGSTRRATRSSSEGSPSTSGFIP